LNEEFTLLIRYDSIKDVSDIQHPIDDYNSARDFTLGLTWSFNSQWQLSVEHHLIDGGLWLPPVTKTIPLADFESDWEITGLQLSYHF